MRGTGLKQCKDYDACGVAGEGRVERRRPLRRPGRNDGAAVIRLATRAGTPLLINSYVRILSFTIYAPAQCVVVSEAEPSGVEVSSIKLTASYSV